MRRLPARGVFLQVFDEGGEGFLADVVLDAFGVGVGDRGGDAERFEERDDDLVAAARFFGEFAAGLGEKNGAIGQGANQSLSFQPLDGAADGHVGDAEASSQVDHARFAGGGDQLGDNLHVILGGFLGMFLPRVFGISRERHWSGL